MSYVVYWEDKEGHIRTGVFGDEEKALEKLNGLVGKYDRCGINCHGDNWIKVGDALPTEIGQECWVWSDEWENGAEPDTDTWEGNRGEAGHWANGPEETRDFIRSGWYTSTGMNITHWMPVKKPSKPGE